MNNRILQTLLISACVLATGAAQDRYGAGSPGFGGFVPQLSCNQAWMGNVGFAFSLDNCEGGAAALLGVSLAPANIPLGGPTILISPLPADLVFLLPVAVSGMPGVPGTGSGLVPHPLAVAVTPSLAGFEFYAQAVTTSPTTGQAATSNGLVVELAMPPKVFVGTSVGGSADPTYIIDPLNQNLDWQFNSNANNVTDAEFAHGGRRIYVSLGLGNSVQEIDMETSPPTWSTFYTAPGSCYGLFFDKQRDILYTLTGASLQQREIVAIDAALGSPTYGQVMNQTLGIGTLNGSVERWEGSPDGTQIAVLTVFSPQLVLVDSDPASPSYLQWVPVGPIPLNGILPIAVTPGFTPGNEQLLISVSLGGGPGEVVRYDLLQGQWIDHDPAAPGIQNIGPSSVPFANVPSSAWELDVSRDGTFAVVSGWNAGGSVGRVDVDVQNPTSWSYTTLASGALSNAWSCSLSSDDSQVAVALFGGTGGSQVLFLDALTGTNLGSVAIPGASNVYTVKWF